MVVTKVGGSRRHDTAKMMAALRKLERVLASTGSSLGVVAVVGGTWGRLGASHGVAAHGSEVEHVRHTRHSRHTRHDTGLDGSCTVRGASLAHLLLGKHGLKLLDLLLLEHHELPVHVLLLLGGHLLHLHGILHRVWHHTWHTSRHSSGHEVAHIWGNLLLWLLRRLLLLCSDRGVDLLRFRAGRGVLRGCLQSRNRLLLVFFLAHVVSLGICTFSLSFIGLGIRVWSF